MWQTWKDNNESPEHMEPLLNSLQPLLRRHTNRYAGKVPVHTDAIHAEVTNRSIVALRRYDPTRSQINTHLTNELKAVHRYVVNRQNLSRITEDRANKVGQYQRSTAILYEELGRQPSSQEVADHMKVSLITVTRLEQEVRKDLLASGAEADPFLDESPRDREILRLIPHELNRDEMLVFECLTGYGGKQKITSTGKIALKLGWSASKVSQVKLSIANKINQYR